MLTRKALQEIVSYDPRSGVFTYKVKVRYGVDAGSKAGSTNNPSGYRRVMIGRKTYDAHRLAWLYMTGEWPA